MASASLAPSRISENLPRDPAQRETQGKEVLSHGQANALRMHYGSHRFGESDSPKGRFREGGGNTGLSGRVSKCGKQHGAKGEAERRGSPRSSAAPGGGKRGLQGCLESGEAASGRAQGLGYSSEEAEGRFLSSLGYEPSAASTPGGWSGKCLGPEGASDWAPPCPVNLLHSMPRV